MPELSFKQRILPDAGKVLATLVSVEEVDNRFYDAAKDRPERQKQLEWTFSYDDRPDMQIRVWSTASLATFKGRKSRALEITEALLDKELGNDEKSALNTDSLLGKKCYLEVRHVKSEDGQVSAKVKEFQGVSGLPF